jgi:RHH-type proline utilization regulon transcriptional repressor/proline dehydrogenase/delta 1-pyrroline-5-carboxylate dehydrogenase
VVLTRVGDAVKRVIEAAQPGMEYLEFDRVRAGARSDQTAWDAEFGVSRDVSSLGVERNVFRYLPMPVTIRLADGASISQLVRALAAATLAKSPVSISTALPLPASLIRLFRSGSSPLTVTEMVVESDVRWHERAGSGEARLGRVRLLGGSAEELARVIGGNPDVAIYAGPITTSGRIELLPFLREQSVSITAHRFGNADPAMVSLPI